VIDFQPFKPEPLVTDRLLLRPPKPEDGAAIFDGYASDLEVVRYMTWRPHQSVAESEQFVLRLMDAWLPEALDPKGWAWILERKESRALVGMLGVRRDRHDVTLGYVLSRAHWGQGLMPEAARAVMARAFQDPTVFRVSARCDVDNLASARVMEKIGMRREGLLRRTLLHPNMDTAPRDGYVYAAIRESTRTPEQGSFSTHSATVLWERRDERFTDNRYHREHRWRFDGGAEVLAAASPHAVPIALTNPSAVDPEEAFVAALSSCHMLWFLSLAARAGFTIDRYSDSAEGELGLDENGKRAITRVTLRPRVDFSATPVPSDELLRSLHRRAHEECFLARSIRAAVQVC